MESTFSSLNSEYKPLNNKEKDFPKTDLLRSAVRDFLHIGLTGDTDSDYNRVIAGMHVLSSCIRDVASHETEEEIFRIIEPARRLQRLSPLYKRLQDWPRGYPGDFETIEYLLKRENGSKNNSIAYHCESYALNNGPFLQHYNKIVEQSNIILKTALSGGENTKRILSIGCSSSYDLRIIKDIIGNRPVHFTLIDNDQAALDYSKEQLGSLADRCEFIHGHIFRLLRRMEPVKYDLIVSTGLFDYIPDKMFTSIFETLYIKFLKKGGKIYFANISPDNPFKIMMEYFINWKLIDRTKDEIIALCNKGGINPKKIRLKKDPTNITYLVEITK